MANALRKICMICFQITMPLFMIFGAIMVALQLVGAVTGNAHLVVDARSIFRPLAFRASTVCIFASFVNSYLDKEE
jgi:hypothetical protein